MVSAKITITLREEFGLTEASRAHPEATFRYLAGIQEPDRGLGLVDVRAADLDAVLDEISASPVVRKYQLLDRYGRRAIFQYETDVADLYLAVREAGIIPAFPYTIRDGVVFFETTTTPDRLSRLGEILRARAIPFEVTTLSQSLDAGELLTDRQRQIVRAAIASGYYDTPRRCSVTDLAEKLGVASSTASQTLHRAESRVMKQFAARHLAGDDPR
jgi:predicted DNA binding protein